MNRKFALIALAALALISTGCGKKEVPAGASGSAAAGQLVDNGIIITDAPQSAVLVGEKFTLKANHSSGNAKVEDVVWSSSNPSVAKVNDQGKVLATGSGNCEISATAGTLSGKVAISVNDRDPGKDEMGHVGNSKLTHGQNNSSTTFSIGNNGWQGEIWYQGGNNSMTYYDNGTFTAVWSGTSDFLARVGYSYGMDTRVTYDTMQYDCYFKHSKKGSAGGYNYIGVYGWTLDPLVEYYIVDDWFNKPGANLLGQKKGQFTVDGDIYEIYQNTRIQQPCIVGTATFPQYFSVRRSARQAATSTSAPISNNGKVLECGWEKFTRSST